MTYSIVASGTDANSIDSKWFSINSANGALTFTNAPDFQLGCCGAETAW